MKIVVASVCGLWQIGTVTQKTENQEKSKNMNMYMHPDEIEEMEYQANAKYDYLSEAFGAEARLLAAQAEDEEVAGAGYTSRSAMLEHWRSQQLRRAAAESISASKSTNKYDDVPF